jgi:hypothetical protein
MKPVQNKTSFPYKIGAELAYIGEFGTEYEHGGIFVEEYKMCRKLCKHGTCYHMIFKDESGEHWCMIPEDFEEIL